MTSNPHDQSESAFNLAEGLRAAREARGLDQSHVANRLGVGRRAYAKLESHANPRASSLLRLIGRAGYTLAEIFPDLLRADAKAQANARARARAKEAKRGDSPSRS